MSRKVFEVPFLVKPNTVHRRLNGLSNLYAAAKGERSGQDTEHLDFKVIVEPKDGQPHTVILVASSRQEKSAWTSDISQVKTNKRIFTGGGR